MLVQAFPIIRRPERFGSAHFASASPIAHLTAGSTFRPHRFYTTVIFGPHLVMYSFKGLRVRGNIFLTAPPLL